MREAALEDSYMKKSYRLVPLAECYARVVGTLLKRNGDMQCWCSTGTIINKIIELFKSDYLIACCNNGTIMVLYGH